ncbi:GTPase-activating protein RGD2 KNAG_0E03000 [Huiozyma naganishii CBS 8797]|uniref:Rho-GAP domain-containing protein n=1 Tax=Huiozyma naganishii (strain ATCC MYA-139 / BCRC 22969 / CBS 8797 / KCTC 17520 / NBRC 10181 / NCYC 3082 / Yp74L-3) TaxID=1071383 RepID=J7S6T4_HUIN7|nr:hypothetical protein KNAG_0E03000 [Kazachstania naganishii CBS 8797]CCK70559.1 hypothetical protein KNAG_0E03000 [Kazachstania naganishii CBS 8797]
MPSFSDSFWSDDLSSGLNVLFAQLEKGCDENESFIQLFASRMQYEVSYGRQLCAVKGGIDVASDSMDTSTAASLLELIKQMELEGDQHLTVASNIEALVLKPFSSWCQDHKERITYSQRILLDNIRNFQKINSYVQKLESQYFKNCKRLEDFKRVQFRDTGSLDRAMKHLKLQKQHEVNMKKEKDNQVFGTVGNIEFDFKTMKDIIRLLLTKLPKEEYKLPLISYQLQNTNNGYDITKFLLEHMSLKDSDQAEIFGQDLLNLGFLKYCNGMGNTFVNSKKFQYQWKDYSFKFVELPLNQGESPSEPQQPKFTTPTKEKSSSSLINSSTVLPGNVLEPPSISENERQLFKLMDEVQESDSKYFKECYKMDSLRCSIEELMIDHLSFMEKCELDRLKAVKKSTMDFCAAVSNKISILKVHIEKMIDAEERIDPDGDLLNLIAKYNTGLFQPKVITYNNYFNPGIYQNFGIDLETRCRLDKKVVPIVITTLLSYMDKIYPELPSDQVRVSTWTDPVKLSLTHELRSQLNKPRLEDDAEMLSILEEGKYSPSVIASVLKIYLLELPEPLIPSELSDILRVLYGRYWSDDNGNGNSKDLERNEDKRITGLYTTLSSLRKPHLATLGAITTHFYRLIKIIKMAKPKENDTEKGPSEDPNLVSPAEFTNNISKEFANSIVHARVYSDNELGFQIFHDLLTHKRRIFGELKKLVSSD